MTCFFFLPLCQPGAISKLWQSSHSPTMQIYPERPENVLQLFYHRFGLYVPLSFKHKIRTASYQAGCEVPFPTTHPDHNHYNGQSIVRRSLKAHYTSIQAGLSAAGCPEVWLGQCGCKYPAKQFVEDFSSTNMGPGSAFDFGWQLRGSSYIDLFGALNGRASLPKFFHGNNLPSLHAPRAEPYF